jgi:acyl-ACP thioesterase
MKAVYEKEYDLRPSDFDCHNRLLPGAILDIFQDAAGRHSVMLGSDIYTLDQKGLIWVVAKTRFEITGNAKMYQTVKVKTWPLKPSKITFRREYIISDLKGVEIARGSSEWVVVDKVRRRICPSIGIYNTDENNYLEELAFENKISKIHSFTPTDEGFAITPRFSDIDINGHVNNTKYANYVIDAIAKSEMRPRRNSKGRNSYIRTLKPRPI